MHCSALIGDFFSNFSYQVTAIQYQHTYNTEEYFYISTLGNNKVNLFKMFFIFLFYIEKVTI